MKRGIVKTSKLIFSQGYDPETQILEIRFKAKDGSPGHIYQYRGVPKDKYKQFLSASSMGQFFLKWIKPFHDCERMDKDEAKPEAPETEAPEPEPPAAA